MMHSLLLGIAAAFMPCNVVFILILLYRFGIWGNKKIIIKDIISFFAGYFSGWIIAIIIALLLQKALVYSFLRLIFGSFLIWLGIWQIKNQQGFRFTASNSFLLGLLFPIVVTSSPCSLPFFSALLISLSSNTIIQLALYAVGLILPSIVAALIGQVLFNSIKKISKYMHFISLISGTSLIIVGILLNLSISKIQHVDLYISGIVLLLGVIALAYVVFSQPHNRNISNIIMLASYLIMFAAFLFHCNSLIHKTSTISDITACGAHNACKICTTCGWLFSLAAFAAGVGYLISKGLAQISEL